MSSVSKPGSNGLRFLRRLKETDDLPSTVRETGFQAQHKETGLLAATLMIEEHRSVHFCSDVPHGSSSLNPQRLRHSASLLCVWQGWRPSRQPCHTHILYAPRSGA